MGSLRVGHDWVTSLLLFTFMLWRRKWQPPPVFLVWRIPGTGEPSGLPSMGSHRVGHDWCDLAAAAYRYRYHIFFIHSSSTGLSGCFYVLGVVNNPVVPVLSGLEVRPTPWVTLEKLAQFSDFKSKAFPPVISPWCMPDTLRCTQHFSDATAFGYEACCPAL